MGFSTGGDPDQGGRIVMVENNLSSGFGHAALVDKVSSCGEFSKEMPPVYLPWGFFQVYRFSRGIGKIEKERL